MIRYDDGFGFNPNPADNIGENADRLSRSDIRDAQDTFNANMCDGNDETWFDDDPVATDSELTIISDAEFFDTFVQ